jgi:predicted small lipoprotein YifL
MYRIILMSSIFFSLTACGHYGPLYYPEDAAYHQHHPEKSIAPKTAVTAKQTEEYKNIDQLSIPEIIAEEENKNDN